jgi:hypothetical protein
MLDSFGARYFELTVNYLKGRKACRDRRKIRQERFEAAYRRQARNPAIQQGRRRQEAAGGGRYITEVVLYPISGEIVLLDAKASSDETPDEVAAA